ncbi:hypothetical protein GDO86_004980 [Hymenochirus boettgeri]|uniref:SMC hinge domain-containing protein n=1 Tax=Hymenochirus boettgeri TaxID=247094 RepID=A0A8T2J7K4_9PIPI|nr:hypothetical protein GDO86_004980 [Hymenochirus boettgeri]
MTNLRVKNLKELIHGANVGKPVSSTASVGLVYSERMERKGSFPGPLAQELSLNQLRPQFIKAKENTAHHVNKKHVEDQIEDLNKRTRKMEEYISTCTKSLEEQSFQEEQLINETESGKQRIAEINEQLGNIVQELQNARLDFHEGSRQRRKEEVLESMKRMYPDAVFGRLFELCHPIHKKYQLAITKVFGRYMNSVIVSTEKTARECIRYLREERAEPETFLALDYLDVKPINEKLRELKGSKLLIDVVQAATVHLKKVVQFVCGNGLVCETIKEAKHVAFDGPERLKTVSLDGTLFSKSGVISGGSSDLRVKAKRWDEKAINELKEERDQLMSELRDLLKLRRKESDLKQLQAQMRGTQTRLKYSQNDLDVVQKKQLANCFMEKSKYESELANITSQLTMLRNELDIHSERISCVQDQMNQVEDEVFREFCEMLGVPDIRVYEEEHVQQQQETDKKRLEFENQKTRLGIQLEYSRGQLEKQKSKVEKLLENLRNEEGDTVRLKKEEERCMRLVDTEMVQQQQLKHSYTLKKSQVTDAQKKVEEAQKKLLVLNREAGKKQKEAVIIEGSIESKKLERHNLLLDCKVQDLQIVLESGSLDDITQVELETESGSLTSTANVYEREGRIQIDYRQLPDDLLSLITDTEISSALMKLRQEVITHENTLLKTAPPNLKALEKLDSVKDRFQETLDEFEASRRKARHCRNEFEQVKKRRYELFCRCFEHISVAIDQIYKKLCQNSSAQAFLSPENSEEPYLAGIGYNCVAPGKRFMPMDNLSGGEKSVAALALLFAIHSFRPAPFLVLDEIDAALDNTNIRKVTGYIKEQSRINVQMVIISLKEEFYSKADALIGVCTQRGETISSKVLTLDLTVYAEEEEPVRSE